MMKKIILIILLFCWPFIAGSHIGNPSVTFEGNAGAYSLLVLIDPPDVIPGTATINIYSQAPGIDAILSKPVYWFAGDEGTPEADEMVPVIGEPGHYSGKIWLMSYGTSGIDIEVTGKNGKGNVLVPVMAVATAQNEIPASLSWILAALGLLLFVLMVTIISACVSDGLVKSDDTSNTAIINRKRRTATLLSSVLLIAFLWGGKFWWDDLAATYKKHMYKPFRGDSQVLHDGNKSTLLFSIKTERTQSRHYTRDINYIIPDHGKLMHMFLVRAGSMDVFAHLHPQRKDSTTFIAALPPLPSGKYLLFADITRLTGFSETIPDTVEIEERKVSSSIIPSDSSRQDKDDTYFITNPLAITAETQEKENIVVCGKPGTKMVLEDGASVTWELDTTEPLIAGKIYTLKFIVAGKGETPANLEPYMGMMGHAVVLKSDGSVYIHLHPVGNYSMASQETMLTRFEKEVGPVKWDKIPYRKEFTDSIDQLILTLNALPEDDRNKFFTKTMQHEQTDAEHPGHALVTFPYAFPSSGSYRIWIQMKRNGKIMNSAFDAVVE